MTTFNWVNFLFGGFGFVLASLIYRHKERFLRSPKFSFPTNGIGVPHQFKCSGTSSKWLFSQQIWIFVCPEANNRLYPQRNTASKQLNGDWAAMAFVGSSKEEEIGHGFLVYAVTANSKGTTAILEYIAQCGTNDIWTGLERWPDGCTARASISVTHIEEG